MFSITADLLCKSRELFFSEIAEFHGKKRIGKDTACQVFFHNSLMLYDDRHLQTIDTGTEKVLDMTTKKCKDENHDETNHLTT